MNTQVSEFCWCFHTFHISKKWRITSLY